MPLGSWLFVKDSENIWIERPYGRVVNVAGPGTRRDQRKFLNEESLQAYQTSLARLLSGQGWFLWGVDRERRVRADRRWTVRTTHERRRQTTP